MNLKAVIIGAGHRALTYASYAEKHPDELEIEGMAEPIALRREQTGDRFSIPVDRRYETSEALSSVPKFADCAINGTMDHQHVATTLPLLKAGYDILLEKPFATDADEMQQLVDSARTYKRKVMICHVLRYAPFYYTIRERVAAGEIGRVINVQTVEHVSYHHMAVGYVRGKWNNKEKCRSSMLMAKCCHDLDLVMWMKSGVDPTMVSSFGTNTQFRPEMAPEGAGNRCLGDCEIEFDCLYSARKHYIDHPKRWAFYVWDTLEHIENLTLDDKIASLEGDNDYGRCVWKCDNDVVDHQSVTINFEDGCTATHNMVGGTARPSRSIHLIGTAGEIQGVFEDGKYCVRHIDPRPGEEYSESWVDMNEGGDMHGAFGGHGGGDLRLMKDFVDLVNDGAPSLACTRIEDSVNGHLTGFLADKAMEEECVVRF